MMDRIRKALNNIDPLVMVGAGITLLTLGLNGFSETLRALKEQAEDTIASLAEAAMTGAAPVALSVNSQEPATEDETV